LGVCGVGRGEAEQAELTPWAGEARWQQGVREAELMPWREASDGVGHRAENFSGGQVT